jgi:predicted amidophosphoribosyltransferase
MDEKTASQCLYSSLFYPIVKYMTKTCGKCGHAALDDQAQFCNRCGSSVPEEKKPAFPVCPGCGTIVSDELAQFCNRCGTRIPILPMACRSCGNPANDSQSRFCTRCGTTFDQKPVSRNTVCPSCGAPDPHGMSVFCNRCGSPFNRPGEQAALHPGAAPVIVTQRKPAADPLTVTVPDSDWEPWNDPSRSPGFPGVPGPAEPEQPPSHDRQIAVPQKRYDHLPLVAEEMKKKGDSATRPLPSDTLHIPGKKNPVSQKKGVLGFMKT